MRSPQLRPVAAAVARTSCPERSRARERSFERETANLKAHYERELASRKGQAELDTITLRAEHAKELAARDARIQQLETTVRELSTARDTTLEGLLELVDLLLLRSAQRNDLAVEPSAVGFDCILSLRFARANLLEDLVGLLLLLLVLDEFLAKGPQERPSRSFARLID
jgi:hypothetical protein